MSARKTDWVIGRGLLGSSVLGELSPPNVWTSDIRWADPDAASTDLAAEAAHFLAGAEGPHRVFWCAGKGVTSTPEAQLVEEVGVFRRFLEALATSAGDRGSGLRVFLASSVGGAYGGRTDPPFTEATDPVASSAYGRAKIAMEEALREWAAHTGGRAFIARITNLYGPGQDLSKGQGLITTILRSHITATPTSVYVSLDTLRDYIYARDCARVAIAGAHRLDEYEPGTTVVKIVGFGNAVSIGSLLAETRRLRRSIAPVVLGQGDAAGQASDLRIRSTVWTDLDSLVDTTLPAGIHATFHAMLSTWTAGAVR